MGPVTYPENLWSIRCGDPTVLYLAAGTISLGGAQLNISAQQVIEIHGHSTGSTLDAQALSRVFDVAPDAQLTLQGVTLVNGRADNGGCLRVSTTFPGGASVTGMTMHHTLAGRVTMRNGAMRGCQATNNGGGIATNIDTFAMGIDVNLINVVRL